MCEWYRREFGCRHYLIGAASWCPDYSRTGRRCEVRVVYIDYSAGDCTGCSNRRTEESTHGQGLALVRVAALSTWRDDDHVMTDWTWNVNIYLKLFP
ncbi:hypothetical protein BN1723_004505 [Verticillium longisporum]|uniref:Uncharacterized protein n=1 Tax=Verticillium longisporum TaxID=100787 RepID=A0A0G4MYL4_VERLO|nr:hypothetical protein BN1723_004505 [Verticillium longisporum]